MLSPSERLETLRIARHAVALALGSTGGEGVAPSEPRAAVFREKRGVFVTVKRYPGDDLRGCIGYPMPILPLGTAIERAAVAAALDDPRFPPIRASELSRITLEVSVLTVPEAIPAARPENLVAAVEVGRDGLIVDGFGTSGILLPQVAPEQSWTAEQFLAGTCEKAGLPSDSWRRPGVSFRRFQAEVFREGSPGGELIDEPPPTTRAARPARRK